MSIMSLQCPQPGTCIALANGSVSTWAKYAAVYTTAP
jgi:hypothetical protein